MPLNFGRRKSLANVLETTPEAAAPAQSSFRVLERVQKIDLSGKPSQNEAKQPVQRPFNSPLISLRGKSAEELSSTLNQQRGSGGTTASGSSGYYESSSASARHSSSSTLPSSVDAEREPREEELFPKKTKTAPMYRNHATDVELPDPPKSFTSRAARALSFGQKHNRLGSGTEINHVPPIPPAPSWPAEPARSHSPKRDRALTTSSYASTAKPEPLTLGADFGSEFGNMFASSNQASPSPPPPAVAQHKTESQPIYPPRTVSRNFTASRPSPDFLARERYDAGSPYSWDSRNSNEGLMTSSALSSPKLDGPPVPPHKGGMAADFLRGPKAGYSRVPDRQSPGLPLERLSQDSQDAFIPDKESEDDEYASDRDTGVRGMQLRDTKKPQQAAGASLASTSSISSIPTRKPSGMPSQATAGASRAGAMSPDSSEGGGSLWGSESINATPKAERLTLPRYTEESLFNSSPQGPPSMAVQPGTQHIRTESGTPKKMTKAQFERLQRGGDSSADQSDEEQHSDDDYEDEDDAERAKKLARQRQKQEANMSVYRQQMKKVTGGGPSDLPSMARPSMDRASASAPIVGQGGFHLGGMGGQPPQDSVRAKQSDEDDDDVPLGILQAHGFPSGSRPPTRQEGDGMGQRRASAAGSVVGGGAGQGNLPPFARRLPQDPYFGSSLVNPSQRESLGFGGAPSVHGGAPPQMQPQMMPQMAPQMGHPGGLVGVIAGEERAKAARRGSPNPATGTFGNPMALPQNMPNMPQMPRTMSMGNVAAPQVYTPSGAVAGMPPMPQMPGMMPGMMPQMPQMQNQSQDQMQKFMEMQMQLMQNMISMQQAQMGQTPQPQQQQANDYLGVNFNQPGTPNGQQMTPSINGGYTPSIIQGRAMTMMNPPKGWETPPGGVRPNSAMPATYAPSGYNIGGPGPGYTPSIAPSERSNVGMPSRYRPVETNGNNAGRSQSMTSSLTLQAFGNNTTRKLSPDDRPQTAHENKARASTVRLVDKPKGAPKVTAKPVTDEEEDDGWAEMKKKREDKKRFRFGKKSQTESSFGDIYRGGYD